MRVLLDAYFDNNFGDDLFIEILLKRYSDVKFYTFWKETPVRVLKRAESFANLEILPGGCFLREEYQFDAFVMIGGDVLPDGMNYTERIESMRHVKKCGGFVAMLGFSLYAEYGEKTIEDLRIMASLADSIVTRDKASAQRFQKLVPEARVIESVDMVIAALQAKVYEKKDMLGVIPRRKLYSTEAQHRAYCQGMAKVINGYLEKHESAGVRFLAFSTGEYDDRIVSKDIIELLKQKNKAEVVAYEGNIESFLEAIGTCNTLLTTRFHGLIFALLYRVPFVAVPYEVKVSQLLDEVGYEGIRLPYGEELSEEQVQKAQVHLEEELLSEKCLNEYQQKAKVFFEDLDAWKRNNIKNKEKAFLTQMQCNIRVEKQQLSEENKMLKQQQEELEKWIEILKQQQKALEQQNLEIEKVRKEQTEELQKQYTDLEEVRKQQVAELQSQYVELDKLREQQVVELQKQNTDLEELCKQQVEELQIQYMGLEELRKEQTKELQKQCAELEKLRKEQTEELQNRYVALEELRKAQIDELQNQYAELEELRKEQVGTLQKQNEDLENLRKEEVEKLLKQYEELEKIRREQVAELQKQCQELRELTVKGTLDI